MGFPGIGLGMLVALLWGSGDILATLAAHRLSTFKTTFISQVTSLVLLLLFGISTLWSWNLFVTPATAFQSALPGLFTGCCATLAYFALYRALELGPVAITGPLTATSPIVTLILSSSLLHEHLTRLEIGLVMAGIFGIVLASTNLPELRALGKTFRFTLWGPGVRWAALATLAFGTLDFGIGASVSTSNWFLPGLFTRLFTILFLALFAWTIRLWRKIRSRTAPTRQTSATFSLPGFQEMTALWKPTTMIGPGIIYALLVGVTESVAVLIFSLDTQMVTTGITSALASSYGLCVMLFGLVVYREKLAIHQYVGIALFMTSLILLAL